MNRENKETTATGYVNANGQVTVRNTHERGTDHRQSIYQVACSLCGYNYGANGTDLHDRKCPRCLGGTPGLPVNMEI